MQSDSRADYAPWKAGNDQRCSLNLAEDDGLIEQAPKFKGKGQNALIKSEKGRKRDRLASDDEYQSLVENMRRPAQHVLIAQYETAMR